MIPAKYRSYVYNVATALLGVATIYGFASDQQVVALATLIGAATAGLARANVSES